MSIRKPFATALVILMAITALMAGEQKKVTVRVDGLACPFCAYGLEKKLKKVDGVEKLEIKINDGLAILYFKPEAQIDQAAISKKIEEAGFTPKEITIQGQEAKAMKGQKITLNIDGMSCGGCVARVEKTLNKIDCVHDVTVSLSDKRAEFICTKEMANPDEFVKAVEDLGFQAKIAEGGGK